MDRKKNPQRGGCWWQIRFEHLSLDALPAAAVPRAAGSSPDMPLAPLAPLAPEDLELRHQLVSLLGEHGGNLSATACLMGKARVQIRRWLRRYQIDPTQYRR